MTTRVLGKTFLFLFVFFLLDHCLGSFIERYGLSYNERTVRSIYLQKEKLDILFVGSSHMYSAVDPQIFAERNIKSMNLGLATAGPIYYTYMIRAFLNHNKKPGTIVVEAAYQDFTDKSDNLSYGYFTYLGFRDRLAYYLERKDYRTFIGSLSRTFLNRDYFFSAVSACLGKDTKARWDNGFIYTEGSLEDGQTLADGLKTYHDYFKDNPNHLLDEKFQLFDSILSSLKESGIDVIIIDLPEYRLLQDDPTYQPLRVQFVQKMFHMASRYRYRFIDFNASESCKDLRKDKKLFRSVDHLNWQGGKVFSRILMDALDRPF